MLDGIRKRKNNLIYTFVILAVVAVMAFYGVGKMTKDADTGGGIAAWVNGEIVTNREYQQELEARMTQFQQYAGAQAEQFIKQLHIPEQTLQRLVQYKLFAQLAKKMNIDVPDEELADTIRSLPVYQKNGQFDAENYMKLPNRGLEEKARREQMRVTKLQNYVVDRIRLTPAEVRKNYDLKETKVDVDYAKIDFTQLGADKAPTAGDVAAYVKQTPVSELQAYYDGHKRDFTDKGSFHIKQIRVGIPYQATEAQKTTARQKIDAAAKTVTKDNFSETAKNKSDDEYAKKGGDAGWVTKGTLEAPLEKAIEKLKVGDVSAPVETSFGFFVVQLIERKDEVLHPLAQVKDKIASKLLGEKMKKEASETKRKEWDAMLAAGKPLDGEFKKFKIEVKKTGPFAAGQGYLPALGDSDSLVDAVYELTAASPVAKKLVQSAGTYYYLKLRSVDYAKESEFAKNEDTTEKAESGQIQSAVVMAWVNAFEKESSVKTEVKFDADPIMPSE
jgi:peptidyl-prolyl cis-trans isomerase D